MAKTKEEKAAEAEAKAAKAVEVKAAKEAEAEAKKEKKNLGGKDSVVVSFGGGTREFSLSVHGDNFLDLAQQFADKHNGTIS